MDSNLELCIRDFPRLNHKAYLPQLEKIAESESIVAAIPVVVDNPGDRGPLVITSRQLLFIGERFGRVVVPLYAIHGTSLNRSQTLHVSFGAEQVAFGTPSLSADEINRFVATLGGAADVARTPPAQTAAPIAVSQADELLKFATLRDQGVITDAEFRLKKAQMLGLETHTVGTSGAHAPPTPALRSRPTPGAYRAGPSSGSLRIHTSFSGVVSGELVLEVGSWGASLDIGNSSSAELTADPQSIKAYECAGLPQPLTDKARRNIEKDITRKVFGTQQISFTASEVRDAGNRLIISGPLNLARRTESVSIDLALDGDGNVSGKTRIGLRSFGIKPPKQRMVYEVGDSVTVVIAAQLLEI